MKIRLGIILLLSSVLLFESGCSSTKRPENMTAEEVFKQAMEFFNDEDYLEARTFFEVIKLQYPASQYADDAQYYLAEINYNMGDYILASFNYNRLRSIYPSSQFARESLYKAGLSYVELSPPFDRDQEYTIKAIEVFNLFQRIYPEDNLYAQVDSLIFTMREKLAYKEFFTADLYWKWDDPLSAMVYYESVINNYPDTPYLEASYFGKIRALVFMKKKDEAIGFIEHYKLRFPNGEYLNKVLDLEKANKENIVIEY